MRSGTQHDSNQKLLPSKKQQQPFEPLESKEQFISSIQSISIADEIRKLAKLREEGIITELEFQQMKQDLIRKDR